MANTSSLTLPNTELRNATTCPRLTGNAICCAAKAKAPSRPWWSDESASVRVWRYRCVVQSIGGGQRIAAIVGDAVHGAPVCGDRLGVPVVVGAGDAMAWSRGVENIWLMLWLAEA